VKLDFRQGTTVLLALFILFEHILLLTLFSPIYTPHISHILFIWHALSMPYTAYACYAATCNLVHRL